MILERMLISNFRQFYGENQINFATDRQHNITLFLGVNGAGKTALLNCFRWLFYGKIDMPFPKNILSEKAVAEARLNQEINCKISLNFKYDNRSFTAQRIITGKKNIDGSVDYREPQLSVSYINDSGNTKYSSNPQEVINQIMPPNLFLYFFFDGERIDNLAKPEFSEDIKTGIKNLLGINVLERARDHLKGKVYRSLANELKKLGSVEAADLVDKKQVYEQQKEKEEENLKIIKENLRAKDEEKEKIRKRLAELRPAKELMRRRAELEKVKKEIGLRLSQKREHLKSICRSDGRLVFLSDAFQVTREFLETKRKKKELPAGVKDFFVKDLLESGVCICGTALPDGSPEREAVTEWLRKSGKDDIEQSANNLSTFISVSAAKAKAYKENILRLKGEIADYETELTSIEEELSEISMKLKKTPDEDIGKLETNLESCLQDIRMYENQKGAILERIKNLDSNIKKVMGEIHRLEEKENKAIVAKKRLELCEQSEELLSRLLETLIEHIRKELSLVFNDNFQRILRKDYWGEITEDYELEIYKKMDEKKIRVAKSQGENQVTGLCFICSIVDLAKRQFQRIKEKKSTVSRDFFPGGIYPIVMDSPFGTLDEDYRRLVAETITEISNQLVIMVSGTQWRGEVELVMRGKVGKLYGLTYYTPKKDRDFRSIKVSNMSVPLQIPSSEYEYTSITEIQ